MEEQPQQKEHDFNEEEEQVRVHIQQKQIQPEDEDFMRDFDRLMAESLQSAPVTLQGPMTDLVVPPQAKQKFERKLTFGFFLYNLKIVSYNQRLLKVKARKEAII